ncbi:DUF3302 domain-containing protein [Variovorax sp. J2P1-59]|uniref:DUF3302 domain-containing protein n=1 Tax=Variovorax flavidus TaxID=3053501 RepID=UPI002575536E|nr:DUF3302 domain-containing protein [Variovorax sp. J2P1-59]MDM0073778.1 DUF3302 domain-containing protein [Variovorax sp. J2P1-59]
MHQPRGRSMKWRGRRLRAGLSTAIALSLGWASQAHASFLEGDALDTAADVMSWVVLALVPCLAIAVFWIVHVMPEKIAEKRHHPQKDAIHTLCLLSLVFGGLLWPLAWLWAYTRPIGYKMAFGTEKHEDFFVEHGEKAHRDELESEHLDHLLDELEALGRRGSLTPELQLVRERVLAARARRSAAVATVEGGAA